MNPSAIARLVLAASLTCDIAAARALSPVAQHGIMITLERGPCEARCAVYRLTLDGAGHVVYVGGHFVHKAGRATARVQPDAVHQIARELEALDFFALKEAYGRDPGDCVARQDDAPTAALTLNVDGRHKTVQHNVGCTGPVASRLSEIAAAIDRLAGVSRWTK
ncbi:DUF6438 domain-containing protein [Bradyrhizobium sp. 2TAF24]|uniref:DUF6438 domain-containing protein n=1 Tax=Bradyrhizobium sp. 2TAF24 TaxID=3233011 RepID=UPI003F8EE1DC